MPPATASPITGVSAVKDENVATAPQTDPTTPTQPIHDQTLPRGAQSIALILKSFGVTEMQPNVLFQLQEFAHRYTSDILQDALIMSEHCGKTVVDIDDVKEAVHGRIHHSFAPPPSQEFIKDLASQINHTPLPPIQDKFGVRMPLEKHCLSATNYQIVPDASALGINRSTPGRSPRPAPSEEHSPEDVSGAGNNAKEDTNFKPEEKESPTKDQASSTTNLLKPNNQEEEGEHLEENDDAMEVQQPEEPQATIDEEEDSDFEEVDDTLKSTE